MGLQRDVQDPNALSSRLARSALLQVRVAVTATILTIILSGLSTLWDRRGAILAAPVDELLGMFQSSWLVFLALAYAFVFTLGYPIAALLTKSRILQLLLTLGYQIPWFVYGATGVFLRGQREPSLELILAVMLLQISCILLLVLWTVQKPDLDLHSAH
ncbi:hypothetical protein ACSBLW_13090 [Thioclava sp. FR2]|uniref:hypothetical protein n=1 Tax=Thioclava sp. FR2 TaxID=3445780 RepID=UPI003EBA953C